ncbi:MAG: ribbon-helix-helix domain-containing protein [Thermoplasmatales archaeon]|nr:ribbon-helix-helix domain-containing protein [Thermoplasmatales archaeon]
MGETVVVTVELPNIVDKEVDRYSKEYMSKGEFVRSAIIRYLRKLGFFRPWQEQIKKVRAKVQKTGKKFDPEDEIKELRKIREKIWAGKYASRS